MVNEGIQLFSIWNIGSHFLSTAKVQSYNILNFYLDFLTKYLLSDVYKKESRSQVNLSVQRYVAGDFTDIRIMDIRTARPRIIIWGSHNKMSWVRIECTTRYSNLNYYATRALNIYLYLLYAFNRIIFFLYSRHLHIHMI